MFAMCNFIYNIKQQKIWRLYGCACGAEEVVKLWAEVQAGTTRECSDSEFWGRYFGNFLECSRWRGEEGTVVTLILCSILTPTDR